MIDEYFLCDVISKSIIVCEERRNSVLNVKKNIIQELEPYRTDSDIYISFTDIVKIGIHPRSSWEFTPNAIYTFPLKEIWNDLVSREVHPSWIEKNYVFVLKSKSPVKDVSTYTKDDLLTDVKKIESMNIDIGAIRKGIPIEFKGNTFDDVNTFIKSTNYSNSRYFKILWNITKAISRNQHNWNMVLRSLGYHGISDRTGKGMIHTEMPIQAFFLSINDVKVITMFKNIEPKTDADNAMNRSSGIAGQEVIKARRKKEKKNVAALVADMNNADIMSMN